MDPTARQSRVSPRVLTGKIIALNGAIFWVVGALLSGFLLVTHIVPIIALLASIFGGLGLLELLAGGLLVLLPVKASPTASVVNQFYTALAHQEYMTAFQCLNPLMQTPLGEPISLDWFIENARANDSANGMLARYILTGVRANSLGRVFTMRITRAGHPYRARLFLQRQGSEWKIRDFDGF